MTSYNLQWFHEKADNENDEETLDVLKAKADHAFACHNFDNAGDLYGLILQKQISMPIFREACEGRVRCLIKKPTRPYLLSSSRGPGSMYPSEVDVRGCP